MAGLAVVIMALATFGRGETNTLSITLNTNSWSIGTVPVGSLTDTWLHNHGSFAVTNSGNVTVTLYVCASNSTPSGWIPSASPGWDRFRMRWSPEDGSALPDYRYMLASPTVMIQGLATNQVFKFDVEFAAPIGSGQVGVLQDILISIMAVEE